MNLLNYIYFSNFLRKIETKMQFTLVVFLLSLNAGVYFELHELNPFNYLIDNSKSLLGVPKILKNISLELKKNLQESKVNKITESVVDLMAVGGNHEIHIEDKLIDNTISYGKWVNHKIVDWTGEYKVPYIHPIEEEDVNLKFDLNFKRSVSEGYSFLI
jgi:hypothetical protein